DRADPTSLITVTGILPGVGVVVVNEDGAGHDTLHLDNGQPTQGTTGAAGQGAGPAGDVATLLGLNPAPVHQPSLAGGAAPQESLLQMLAMEVSLGSPLGLGLASLGSANLVDFWVIELVMASELGISPAVPPGRPAT